VSGEASAVARFLHEGVALPLSNAQPMARCGPSGRPTVVSNAETAAHVGLLLRMGAEGWRRCGTDDSPGPHLATLAGAVREPGAVAEVLGAVTIGEILQGHGVSAPPLAVLLGGYAGTWLPGSVAWTAPWDDAALARLGAGQGCGLIGVLPHGACGLVETARLSAYLAGESAGQCGPCVHGLPVVAEAMQTLASGSHGRRRALGRLHRTMRALPGSGACRHPDGVVRMVQSALRTFESDAVRHGRGKPCSGAGHPPVFPLPARGHGGR
jgi:NADH:ubiquinone oxidoreductase subunit F (NADH-binding)